MSSKFCRLCCKNEGTTYLFHKDANNVGLYTKIMHFCPAIILKEDDGLPSFICVNCEKEAAACYQFVLKCEVSDKYLRSQSFNTNSQNINILRNCNDNASAIDNQSEIKFTAECDHYEDAQIDNVSLQLFSHDIKLEQNESKVVKKMVPEVRKISRLQITQNIPSEVQTESNKIYKDAGKFINRSGLVTSIKPQTNPYAFPCSLCDKKYKNTAAMKRHMTKHTALTRERNFICESCGKAFFSKNDVKIHMRTHTGETPYKCTECPAKFTQLGALVRHRKRHTGEKDHMCSMCPKRFCTHAELKMHFIVHSTEKKYKCTICNTPFKYQSNLTKHRKRHLESLYFICNYCQQNFKSKGNLKIHIERRHSEKSGYCQLCSRQVPNLETHMWRHNGKRPFKCEFCMRSFYELRALAHHVNFKHKNTDKYKCDVKGCSTMFPSRPMLDFHIAKLHSTEFPFPCDRCTRAFYRKNDLARHKIGTHKEKLVSL